MNNNQSGVNTILLVVIIAGLVGGMVWLYSRREVQNDAPTTVEVSIPGITESEPE